MNITTLKRKGTLIETAYEGTCQLWELKGKRYVVLPDNSIITHEEDLRINPIFKLKQ
jgi:hypothetical protein